MLDEVAGAGGEPRRGPRRPPRREGGRRRGRRGRAAAGLGPWTSGSMVLDLGAGTGQLTVAVAPACARVVAVDVSPVMLRSLRSRVSSPGLANVEVGFLTDRASAPVDVAYSRCARHHLPDFWKSLALSAQQSAQRRRSAASPRSRPTGGLRLRNPPSVSAGLANATAQRRRRGPRRRQILRSETGGGALQRRLGEEVPERGSQVAPVHIADPPAPEHGSWMLPLTLAPCARVRVDTVATPWVWGRAGRLVPASTPSWRRAGPCTAPRVLAGRTSAGASGTGYHGRQRPDLRQCFPTPL